MGLLKPVKWLGRLFRTHENAASAKVGPSTSSSAQPTRIPAFPPSTQKALRGLVSHPSLCECRQARAARQGVTNTTAFTVQRQAAVSRSHRRGPSVDLLEFTRSVAAGKEPFSEDVANRNIVGQQFVKDGLNQNPLWRPEDVYPTFATYHPHQLRKRIIAKAQELRRQDSLHSSNGRKEPRDADARPWTPRSSFSGDCYRRPSRDEKAGRQIKERDVIHASIISLPARLRSLSHKRSIPDLRLARELSHERSQTFPGANSPRVTPPRPPITKADLNKPLPPLPHLHDTTVHTTWAPAVTHHTIQRDVHKVHQEYVTNDYHQDEYEHRVLPIIDHEILPARHFVQLDGGGLEEIPEEDIAVDLPYDLQQRISEAAATIFPAFRDSGVSFLPGDGAADPVQRNESIDITSEGHARRDTTWTYPPVILPSRQGTDNFHQLFVHLDGSDGRAGRTHVRSFSDGPPYIPPRGVRQVDTLFAAPLS